MRMGPIVSFLFKDRFNMRGWTIFPSRMSLAELGFIVLAMYELVRLFMWLNE